MPRPGLSGMASMPSSSRRHGSATISSTYGEPSMYSTRSVSGNAEARCRSAARPTAVFQPCGMKRDAVLLRHPADAPLLADAADFGHVRLHDVERARLQPGRKCLAPGQDFAARDRQRRLPAQDHEIFERIRVQRFFEPGHVIGREHLGRAQRPLEPVGPERVAAAGIDHELGIGADRVTRGADDLLVERRDCRGRTDPSRS